MVVRALKLTLAGYALMGLLSLGLERAGVYGCGCDPDCWCKWPGLNVFRWVLPYGHRGQPGMIFKKHRASAISN